MSNCDKPFSRLQLSAWKYHVLITLDGGCSTWLLVPATLFYHHGTHEYWIAKLNNRCIAAGKEMTKLHTVSESFKKSHQRSAILAFLLRIFFSRFSNTVDWCIRCTSLLWHFFVFQRFYSLVILFWQHCHVNSYFCTASKGPNKAASRSRKKLGFETNDCRNAFTFQKCQDAPVVVLQSSPLHPLKNLRCIDLSFLHFSDLHWQHFGGCESLQRASHLRPGKTTIHYYYPFVHDQSYL